MPANSTPGTSNRKAFQRKPCKDFPLSIHKAKMVALFVIVAFLVFVNSVAASERKKILIKSTADGTMQPNYVILPDGFGPGSEPQPLLVSLHSWGSNLELRQTGLEEEAGRLGWIYLFPHFRGPNSNPKACASAEARQDILDAVDWVIEKYPVDKKRIYLIGSSGGGHMAIMMAGRYPQRWTAVSAWVPISDLAAWWRFHGDKNKYGIYLMAVCGRRPGDSAEVDRQYYERSPINFLDRAVGLPLDIAAGVHDGHSGPVPVRHTLEAFNVLAKAQGKPAISEEEIRQISRPKGRLINPQSSDRVKDSTYKRAIYLRRQAGKTRVTIFDGGHEQLVHAAMEWLKGHVKAEGGENLQSVPESSRGRRLYLCSVKRNQCRACLGGLLPRQYCASGHGRKISGILGCCEMIQ